MIISDQSMCQKGKNPVTLIYALRKNAKRLKYPITEQLPCYKYSKENSHVHLNVSDSAMNIK